MTEWQLILAVIGGTVVLLLLVGSSIQLVRASYHKAKVEELEKDNARLLASKTSLEGDVDRCQLKLEASEQAKQSVINENRILMDMVTQRANVGQVMEMLENHHEEAKTHWEKIEKILATEDKK